MREPESAPFEREMLAKPIEFRNNFKAPVKSGSAKKGPALLNGKVKKGALKGMLGLRKPQEGAV